MTPTLRFGLTEADRPDAARLYWSAFGGKLGKVMGPDDRALAYLARVMRADQVFVVTEEGGRLIGLAGFKTRAASFAGGTFADMVAVYGRAGALWRAALLRALGGDVDNDRFLLDGICVARDWRGQGIGRALLQAICDEARARGYDSVRLDVIDTNWRARALYEREGFRLERTARVGLMRHVFGFEAAHVMVRVL